MANRFRKLKKRMACTLSIQDYLSYFLIKPLQKNEANANANGKGKANGVCHQGSLLLATVYKYEKGGGESIFYSKRMLGEKHTEPIYSFVQEMMGDTDLHQSNGSLIGTTSLTEDDIVTQLPRNSSFSIDLFCSRSPSKVASEELIKLLDHCKINSIKTTIHLTFGHPFSWENKYNKQGIQQLHERGVKLKSLNFQQALNMMFNDIQDNLESLDELQTCRGTICIDYYMLKRAMTKFRNAFLPTIDVYQEETERKLREMLGSQKRQATKRGNKHHKLTSFSLTTYRDYFFLQNTDKIWAKLRISLSKIKHGVTEEKLLFEELHNMDETLPDKKVRSDEKKTRPNASDISQLLEKTWTKVADNITLNELAIHDDIIVNIAVVLSEYPDRMEWHSKVQTLDRRLAERLYQAAMKKIRVESTVHYAMSVSSGSDTTSETSSGQNSKVEADREQGMVISECMHIQDILFDMLEDLEDNLVRLGKVDYERGVEINIERLTLSSAMSLLNKAITIRTEDGQLHSMNSDFIDVFADSVNQI